VESEVLMATEVAAAIRGNMQRNSQVVGEQVIIMGMTQSWGLT
jgi:hypothetical protein